MGEASSCVTTTTEALDLGDIAQGLGGFLAMLVARAPARVRRDTARSSTDAAPPERSSDSSTPRRESASSISKRRHVQEGAVAGIVLRSLHARCRHRSDPRPRCARPEGRRRPRRHRLRRAREPAGHRRRARDLRGPCRARARRDDRCGAGSDRRRCVDHRRRRDYRVDRRFRRAPLRARRRRDHCRHPRPPQWTMSCRSYR
jgi:hypothetical protein